MAVTATWPLTLPQDLEQRGFRRGPKMTSISNEPDAGPPLYRKRFSNAGRPINGTILMSTTQYTAFEEFYDDTLQGGILAFNWRDPITKVARVFSFRQGGNGEPFTASTVGAYFNVSLQLWQYD